MGKAAVAAASSDFSQISTLSTLLTHPNQHLHHKVAFSPYAPKPKPPPQGGVLSLRTQTNTSTTRWRSLPTHPNQHLHHKVASSPYATTKLTTRRWRLLPYHHHRPSVVSTVTSRFAAFPPNPTWVKIMMIQIKLACHVMRVSINTSHQRATNLFSRISYVFKIVVFSLSLSLPPPTP